MSFRDNSKRSILKLSCEFLFEGPKVLYPIFSKADLDEWSRLGRGLEEKLRQDLDRNDTSLPARVYHYYLPLHFWMESLGRSRPSDAGPLIIGINGPQGCGKSTLTRHLVDLASERGFRAVTLSIDDFYLTRKDQVSLAQKYSTDPLLQQRGYPGTHDVKLGTHILAALKRLRFGESLELPIYDKSLEQGQGDRLPVTQWKKVTGPLDWIFFEGWMLGFTEIQERRMQSDPALQVVNGLLQNYEDWNALLDGFVHLIPKDFSYAIQWRVEAEERMKSQGKPGMSQEAIQAYIQKFLPAYRTYVPRLIQAPPVSSDRLIQLELSEERLPFLDSTLHVK